MLLQFDCYALSFLQEEVEGNLVHNKDHSVEDIPVDSKGRLADGYIVDMAVADTVAAVDALVEPLPAVHLLVDMGRHDTV